MYDDEDSSSVSRILSVNISQVEIDENHGIWKAVEGIIEQKS